MPVQAFTNSVGSYYDYKEVIRKVDGFTFGNRPVRIRHPTTVPCGFSRKHETVMGDRVHSTPYTRWIVSLIVDDPFVYREQHRGLFPPYGLIEDLRIEDHISRLVPPIDQALPPQYWGLLENAKSQCITEARNRLREGKVQNGADLAEARQTANLLSSYSVGALRGVSSFMRREGLASLRNLSVGQLTKGLSNRYLEMIFGIMPLLSSINDNAALLHQMAEEGVPWDLKTQKSKSVVYETEESRNGNLISQWKIKGKVKCGLTARMVNPLLSSADTFGVLNPLSISWELMPMSFVLDWFIPVGNVLDSLSATLGLQFEDGYLSYSTEAELKYRHADVPNLVSPGKMVTKHFAFRREPLLDFPVPELYAKDNPFSSKRLVTALALLTQRIL